MPVVLDLIQKEVTSDLRFCFYKVENRTNPRGLIKINDTISFYVILFNPSDTDLSNLLLKIKPGKSSEFSSIESEITMLSAKSNIEVIKITAIVKTNPKNLEFFNSLAELTLTSLTA